MRGLLHDRLVVVWLVLVAATLLSAGIGGTAGLVRVASGDLVSIAVLSIAFGKVAAVVFTYMDVRGAPRALKILCGAWLAIVLSVLIGVYVRGL